MFLLRHTGFRGSDVVALRREEIHFDREEIARVTQKRKKRVVPIHTDLLFALRMYIRIGSETRSRSTRSCAEPRPMTWRRLSATRLRPWRSTTRHLSRHSVTVCERSSKPRRLGAGGEFTPRTPLG